MTNTSIISVRDLTYRFGDFVAVDHVNFDVEPGQVIGYLGPNGSGKTTTIRMLLGVLRPSEGWAHVIGFDAASQSEQVRARIGYMSQKFALYDELTARENLAFYADVYGVKDRQRPDVLMDQLDLAAAANQQVRTLSSGWRQRLALAVAIVHQPQLLLLDEPTSGVDPSARRAFWELIYGLVAEGITILVTTHYMDEAEYCNQVGILSEGKLLAMGSPTHLKEALPGRMWDIIIGRNEQGQIDQLLPVLDVLNSVPGVLRASLAGDQLRALVETQMSQADLTQILAAAGFTSAQVEPAQPMMEDVFMSLVKRKIDHDPSPA
ncbi:MAG: ABC transporter ATP-binding protein [Anaerolineales bacterium]|nr:ABC transporter ATP-binding protein [Anaerolineales bacterium]